MSRQITSFQITTHQGYAIMVNEHGQFSTQDAAGEPLASRSLDDLTNRIDELEQKRAKSRKLALAVLNEGGRPGVLTGFNIRTGEATGLGDMKHVYTVYVDVPWIRRHLARIVALKTEVAELTRTIDRFSLRTRADSRSGGGIGAEAYITAVNAYEENYQAKRAAALAAPEASEESNLRLVSEEAGA